MGSARDIRRVGFIGLGTMGRPMARRLRQAGFELVVHDRDPGAAARLVAGDVEVADSPSAVAAATDVVVCMLPHPDVVRDVLIGEHGVVHGVRSGSVVVDMSTSGPDVVRECARVLRRRQASTVDAPVSKGPQAAEEGDLTILVGGDEETLEHIRPVLARMGSTIHYCGPLGSGQAIKVANNLVACANLAILAEALALAEAAGADTDVLVQIMSAGGSDSWQLRNTVIDKVLRHDLTPMFKLSLAAKDVRLAAQLAEGLATRFDCGRGALGLYEEAEARGFGDSDWGAVVAVDLPELAGADDGDGR